MNVYSPQDSGDEYFFDLFDRPKTLELTFSDGSSQEIVLEDNPDEFMEIELDSEVETSFVKVQILDTYESRTGSSKFVGISYLSFDIGDKVAEKPQDEDDSSGSQSEESEEDSQEQEHSQTIMDYVASNLPVILGIAFIVVILMGVAIYFVVRKMHKKKGKLKEGERSFEDK
jgi:preprotein translocase subunit YajC